MARIFFIFKVTLNTNNIRKLKLKIKIKNQICKLLIMRNLSFLFVLVLLTSNLFSQESWDDLAKTPPMGWNSWNKFACNVSEDLIKSTADAMVSTGLKDAGYEYVVIDDCWLIERDDEGNMIPDPERFPNGMKAVGDYIHSLGLKFGIYTDVGTKTCEERPGMRGYEYQDMRTFASWGVDYVKNDWCFAELQNARASYAIVKDAILASGRPMVHSICEWGASQPWEWAAESGHLWRTTFDIEDCWDCSEMVLAYGVEVENFMGFTKILDLQVGLEPHAGPGHWNDPDMLQVGNNSLTFEENKAHFSLWALLAAPLMLGNDIRNMTDEVHDILTNKEVIAINQDKLGKQGVKVRDEGDLEVWVKQLSDGSRAVVLFNRGETVENMSFSWTEIGYSNKLEMNIRDLWKKKDMGKFSGKYSAEVPSHGVITVRVAL